MTRYERVMSFLFDLGLLINHWRIFPRIILAGTAIVAWDYTQQVLAHPDKSIELAAILTSIFAFASSVLAFYLNSGKNAGNPFRKEEKQNVPDRCCEESK